MYGYSASNTNNATVNTSNYSILLYAGETITIGTCGFPDATFSGDTYLRFRNPSGIEVASNDSSRRGGQPIHAHVGITDTEAREAEKRCLRRVR